MFNEYIGKKITVVQKDNFTKFGILISCDNLFIRLRFYNGNIQAIAISEIKTISENNDKRNFL